MKTPTRHNCETVRMIIGSAAALDVPAAALLPVRRWLACASVFAWNVRP